MCYESRRLVYLRTFALTENCYGFGGSDAVSAEGLLCTLQPAKMLELADREKSDSIAFLELFLTKTILGQTSCFLSRNFFVSLFPADAKISRAQKRDKGKIQKDPSLRFPRFNRTVPSFFKRYKFHR